MPNPKDDQVHTPDEQQVDPRELSGEQEGAPKKPAPASPDDLADMRKRLEALQKNTEKEAESIAEEALSVILSMGWAFGARLNKDTGEPEFCIVPVPLEMWQDIQREILRNKLSQGSKFIV